MTPRRLRPPRAWPDAGGACPPARQPPPRGDAPWRWHKPRPPAVCPPGCVTPPHWRGCRPSNTSVGRGDVLAPARLMTRGGWACTRLVSMPRGAAELPGMEKKRTNSSPFRELTRKHSIYPPKHAQCTTLGDRRPLRSGYRNWLRVRRSRCL